MADLCTIQNFVNFYRPQQSTIFAPVCYSVHRGNVCLSACWDTTSPPLEQTPPWEQTPPEQTPPSRHPPEQTHTHPTQSRHPPGSRHTHPPGADTHTPPKSRYPPRADTHTHPPPPRSRYTPPPKQTPPPGSRLRYTVNERPVRILLECILVSIFLKKLVHKPNLPRPDKKYTTVSVYAQKQITFLKKTSPLK